MQHADTLIAELEVSLPERPSSQRFTILRKLTDLFLAEADAYSDECTQLFDELMTRLIEQIERQALIELSNRLAPVKRALPSTIGQLSRHDDIDIAEPVLAQSGALTERDLVEIAKAKSQGHLRAIAGRARLGEPVTEILVDRGDAQVAAKVAGNPGARFSRWTLDKVVARAEKDELIALAVANRIDLPPDLLDQLVRRATTAVQQRLFANSRPETRQKISQVLAIVSDRVARSTAPSSRRSLMKKDSAQLRARIVHCTDGRNTKGLIDALATLAELPARAVAKLVEAKSDEALVALGKACGIGWPDLKKAVAHLMPADGTSRKTPDALFEIYAALSPSDAERAVHFIRTNASRSTARIRELLQSGNYQTAY